jgi:hypothetical protein
MKLSIAGPRSEHSPGTFGGLGFVARAWGRARAPGAEAKGPAGAVPLADEPNAAVEAPPDSSAAKPDAE